MDGEKSESVKVIEGERNYMEKKKKTKVINVGNTFEGEVER